MKTKVYLRAEKEYVEVNISDQNKPKVQDYIKNRWQKSISLIAKILDVPAGLIMKISKNNMEIFLKSENKDNPYPANGKDTLSHGLYCETVIGKNQYLHIENAIDNPDWKDNPDVKLNMISYYGLPIKWGDGAFYGTICVLDNKANAFSQLYKELLESFREMIEQDLMLLEEKQLLEMQSDRDFLTNIGNRRSFHNMAENLFKAYKKTNKRFSLLMMDLDGFKNINDRYGHITGDRVLKRFAKVVSNLVDDNAHFARYGGDEFILISNHDSIPALRASMNDIRQVIYQDDLLSQYKVDFSYGVALMDETHKDVNELIDEADKQLYLEKKNKIRNV